MDVARDNEDQETSVPYYSNVMSSPDDGEVSDSSSEKVKKAPPTRGHEDTKKAEREDEEKRLRRKLLEKAARKKRVSGNADDDEPLSVQPYDQMERKRAKSPIRYPNKLQRDRDHASGRHRHEPERSRHKDHRERSESTEKKGEVRAPRGADPSEDPKVKEGWTQWKQGLTRDEKRHSGSKEDRNRVGTTAAARRSPHRHHSKHHRSRSPKRDVRKEHSSSGWLPKTSTSRSREPSEKKDQQQSATATNDSGPATDNDADRTPTLDEKDDDNSSESSSNSSRKEASPPADFEAKGKREKYSKFESSPEMSEASPTPLIDERGGNGIGEDGEIDDANDDIERIDDDDDDANDLTPEEDADVTIEDEEDEEDLPIYFPGISGCRSVEEFHCLNRIEEGTFGVVYRAKEKRTDEVVALKRLKMEKEKEGFPITSLREINMLLKAGHHPNVVNVREIVVGSNMDKIYLVMEYVEHDMKSLMEGISSRGKSFTSGEVKTLLRQMLSGVDHLHQLWILHRDLKTSNLLLSHRGILKIGDFGLAREYGEPLKPYTPIVVTLWYRSPELLLGIKEYATAIDMWSVGCIFAEFLTLKPLFPGRGEMDQINRIFKTLGTPSDTIWPGYSDLPGPQKATFTQYPYNQLRKQFGANVLSDSGFQLLNKFLTYNPDRRISAREALAHEWFRQDPLPVKPEMFPTWPAKSEGGKHPAKGQSPKAPEGGKQFESELGADDAKLLSTLKVRPDQTNKGFSLRFDAPKFR
uniref:cyclin-dependent kinase n=1 Tax=Plectus sambesii TaxID=2011161 RepID=A0A914W281_9BILA